jgi:predicted transcriptional regulator of viral defense system
MKKKRVQINKLSQYVDQLQSKSDYVFSEDSAVRTLQCSTIAFRHAAQRLIAKKRIARIRPRYFAIVPLEYRSIGEPPPPWYIDSLMKNYYGFSYYVALLSAAELNGAAHQHPQIFQVMTTKPLKPIILPYTRIQFYVKKKIATQFVEKKITPSGYMSVAIPEYIALDLIQYFAAAGGINNVATVLIELAKVMNVQRLLAVVEYFPLPIVQRLGFILKKFTKFDVAPLQKFVKEKAPLITSLHPHKSLFKGVYNSSWSLRINENIEPDL